MNTYRYVAASPRRPTIPDPETIMDQLAENMLEKSTLQQAMLKLCTHGVKQRYCDPLDGLDQLASRVRELRQRMQNTFSLDPLLDQLSRQIQTLVQRELETLREKLESAERQLNEETASFLDRSSTLVKKLEQMRAGARRTSSQACARLEKEFEELFLHKHDLEAKAKALRSEEASRLAVLQQVPKAPAGALRKLKNYQPMDASVGRSLAELKALANEIASLERAQTQPGFSGVRSVGLEEAVEMVKRMLDMERLEARLKKGALNPADHSLLTDILGQDAFEWLDAVERLKEELLRTGYLDPSGEEFRLSPRAIRRVGQKALSDIFSALAKGRLGEHQTDHKGAGQPDVASTKPYGFGDSFNIHLGKTLKSALLRDACRIPIDISPNDFEVYNERRSASCSSVLMIDLSYTMGQDRKLQAAKKVTLALDSLIRSRFPRDTLHIVGFATYARELSREELPRVNLTLGNPFTNIQDGLRLAEKLISRDRGANRQVILITDGEPTAFCKDGALYVDYPPTPEIFMETMKEVLRLTRKGIVINIFMLDDRPSLTEFVEQITRTNKGRAFFSTPQNLGAYLLVDYLTRRRRTIN